MVKWQFLLLLKWRKNVGYSKVSAKTVRAPATRGLHSQATLVSAHRIESCEQSPTSHRRALRGACFWGLKNKHFWLRGCGPSLCTAKSMLQNRRPNHHSRHRAMIVCDTCTQRSAIVFLTSGQLAGHVHTPRLHFEKHMHTEKTPFQHQIWPQKRGQFPDLQFVPFLIEGCFWGPLIGLRNGASQLSFFSLFALSFGAQYLASMAAAATILCLPDRLHHQNVYLLKVSLRNHNHMRSIQLLRLQAYTHTHSK